MNRIRLFFILLLVHAAVIAQPVTTYINNSSTPIQSISVLPDAGYNLKTLLTNTGLPFVINDSIRPNQTSSYWLKIVVNNPANNTFACNLQLVPNLDNTLYYYNANAAAWQSSHNGVVTAGTLAFSTTILPCILRARTSNTFYIKVQLPKGHPYHTAFVPVASIEPASIASRQEQLIWVSWITSLTVLFLFLLNNIYIWLSFKDRTVLYFFIGQLGALVFITSYKRIFSALFHCPLFSTRLQAGKVDWYNANSLVLHGSMLLVSYALVHFVRSYLNTRQTLPKLDIFLRYGLNSYLMLGTILGLINCAGYLAAYTWHVNNIFTTLLYAAVLYISIVGYLRRLPASRPFLIANVLTIGFMLATSIFHLIMAFNNSHYSMLKSLFPDLAIIAHSIGFSIALVSRTRILQHTLAEKETEARQLEFDLREMALRCQLIQQENQSIDAGMQYQKTQNAQLQQKLDANQRELASISLYMAQKNELLIKLKTQLKDVKKYSPSSKQEELKDMESMLQSNLYLDEEWTKFTLHFEQVHPNFFEELKVNHPNLTKNEIRLCAYFHMNLSTKEIAALLNIDPASVRRAKTRLYKKIGNNQA